MQQLIVLSVFIICLVAACGNPQPISSTTNTPVVPTVSVAMTAAPFPSSFEQETETLEAIPSFTPLPGPCATPTADELSEFIKQSITLDDNGKTFVTHITSRFWIYLDNRVYPLQGLLNSIPKGLIGYISNGSIRGPQCYPILFEALDYISP